MVTGNFVVQSTKFTIPKSLQIMFNISMSSCIILILMYTLVVIFKIIAKNFSSNTSYYILDPEDNSQLEDIIDEV